MRLIEGAEVVPCPNCNGEGFIRAPHNTGIGDLVCGFCDGSGELIYPPPKGEEEESDV